MSKFSNIKSTTAVATDTTRKATPQEWYLFHLVTTVLATSELVANTKVPELFNLLQKSEYNRLMIKDRKDIPVYTQLAIDILQDEVSLDNDNGYADIRVLVKYLDSDDTTEATE